MNHDLIIKRLITQYRDLRNWNGIELYSSFAELYSDTREALKLGPGVGIVDYLHGYLRKEYKLDVPLNLFKEGLPGIVANIKEIITGKPPEIRKLLTKITAEKECGLVTPGYVTLKQRRDFIKRFKEDQTSTLNGNTVTTLPDPPRYVFKTQDSFKATHRVKCCRCYICSLPIYIYFSIDDDCDEKCDSSCGDCEHVVPVYYAFFSDLLVGAQNNVSRDFGLTEQYKCSHSGHNQRKNHDMLLTHENGKHVTDKNAIEKLMEKIINNSEHGSERDPYLHPYIMKHKTSVKEAGTISVTKVVDKIVSKLNNMYGATKSADVEGTLALLVLVCSFGTSLSDVTKGGALVNSAGDENPEKMVDQFMDASVLATDFIEKNIFQVVDKSGLRDSFYGVFSSNGLSEYTNENYNNFIFIASLYDDFYSLFIKTNRMDEAMYYMGLVTQDIHSNKILYDSMFDMPLACSYDGLSLPYLVSILEPEKQREILQTNQDIFLYVNIHGSKTTKNIVPINKSQIKLQTFTPLKI